MPTIYARWILGICLRFGKKSDVSLGGRLGVASCTQVKIYTKALAKRRVENILNDTLPHPNISFEEYKNAIK